MQIIYTPHGYSSGYALLDGIKVGLYQTTPCYWFTIHKDNSFVVWGPHFTQPEFYPQHPNAVGGTYSAYRGSCNSWAEAKQTVEEFVRQEFSVYLLRKLQSLESEIRTLDQALLDNDRAIVANTKQC